MEHFMNKLPYNIGIKLNNDETNILKKWIEDIIKEVESNTDKKYPECDMALSFNAGNKFVIDFFNEVMKENENMDCRSSERFNEFLKELNRV